MLIALQKPDASLIVGFGAWKNNHGRTVKKGEKGIRIIAPAPFKVKQEMERLDPKTNMPVIGADGNALTEEKEITIPAYKVVSVFDVSQTEGRELPSIGVNELTGNVSQYEDFSAALKKASPVPIALAFGDGYFTADVMRQTISLTGFVGLSKGARLNLERALRLSDRLGGHLVA